MPTRVILNNIQFDLLVSAESFCIRLEELQLIEAGRAADFKARIRAHYAANAFSEPDGSQRRLNYNGRLGDLLLHARGQGGEGRRGGQRD